MTEKSNLENLCINTIRFLAVDGVQKANSGHPGMPMGCAPIAYSLFTKQMKHNPVNPNWINRDRFVLSAGHGSMLLYSILHLAGYNLPLDELKRFRQWNSLTPGHPEYKHTPGVETTTGPLGQGFTNAVGMAIAQNYLASVFNKEKFKLIDHHIYVIVSDGDMMEGISHEAASLAGHLNLNKLIVFYDYNGISIDGETKLSYSDDVYKRFDAYGWNVLSVEDVNNLAELNNQIEIAKAEQFKPTIIITKTHIGFGSPNKQDKSSSHGSPLGVDEVKATKKNLNWVSEEEFVVPAEVSEFFSKAKLSSEEAEQKWNKLFDEYSAKYEKEAKQLLAMKNSDYGDEWKNFIPVYNDASRKISTRSASGQVLNAIAPYIPALIGGSADLAPSNNTYLKEYKPFSAENYGGRNFHFGVREHGMASIMNGMAVYGGVIPYGGTFLVFADYNRPALRLAAMMKIKVVFIFTHDSIGVGEDGPTHQPVEQIASLRSIPNLVVLRPADANETAAAWKTAIEHKDGPVALILTRQDLLVLDQEKFAKAENVGKGAYILKDSKGKPDIILLASGSEVQHAISASDRLFEEGIIARVVSFPSWELFENQTKEYKDSILLPDVKKRIVVEAGIKMGWEKYAGENSVFITMENYGASAPINVLMDKFGFTADNIVLKAKELLGK
ncbi:MAG: transketolase [Ignavibacteriales bacterium]|nr:MAG: transketolase [Ignavibacteriales bacterium]